MERAVASSAERARSCWEEGWKLNPPGTMPFYLFLFIVIFVVN
jgi:hypothetical protein